MSREIVSRLAYLIGVKDVHLPQFDETIINECKANNDCSLIRKLCQLRNTLLINYNDIKKELLKYKGRLSRVNKCTTLYDSLINKHGLDFELYSDNINDYIRKVNIEIENRIDLIAPLLSSSIQNEIWVYIRNLFVFPNKSIINERKKYTANRELYPFACYINWTPQESGNILVNDIKFLSTLFSINGKQYEISKEEIKSNIYSFVKKCKKVIIGVDCENVDYALFYTSLLQFNAELLDKIEKVLLFDDMDIRSGWKYYKKDLPVTIQTIECPRIQKDKSTLDVKLSSYITAAHYKDGIDGFILVSSDSDYWGLIDTIGTTAKFFILGEKNKISIKNIAALDQRKIPYCLLDDFNNAELSESIKEETYKKEIITILERTKFNIDFFLNILQNQTMYLTEEEKTSYKQLVCELKISFDQEGNPKYYF